jgi:hypothetical protein
MLINIEIHVYSKTNDFLQTYVYNKIPHWALQVDSPHQFEVLLR